ncbi:MAG: aspartate 1-decarboxylase [Alphaproteobacteria bacterium]|jgi:aspartate 1-decarboxylase|nr:aspartate 1-decarboxylase [Alphaproteobacteria bacterium]
MYIRMLKSKIHRATVTQSDLHYEGSITIDRAIMDKADILPYEQVDVLNINNGHRFTTYVIEGKKNSGIIGINGAAARLAQKGDLIIICAYAHVDKKDGKKHKPVKILMDSKNKAKKKK